MELETAKKLIRQYAAGHTDYMQKCAIAERYYRNETDVLYQKKEYGDDDGNPLRNADNRIPRNFHGLIVNQKASYAFTVPPVFDVGNSASNNRVTELLGDEYTKNCMELCINAANMSAGWIHYWNNGNGFEWAVVDSKQIIPIFDKSLKCRLIALLRSYTDLGDDGEKYIIFEFWTDTECQTFRKTAANTLDEGLHYYDSFYIPETGELTSQYQHGFEEIPFIPFWNNNIHTDDLKNIKPLIDVYDKVFSGFINDLDDVQEIIFVLSGYGGTDLNGFLQDLKKYKAISLDDDGDGGVSTLNIEIPIEARNSILEATRKAIFEQGQGFDPQPENFGNQSGEALKFMYSLLEMKTGLMETEFRLGFAKLVRALCKSEGIPCSKVEQVWTRTRIKNDTELAQICRDSVGIISKRTILANHPFVGIDVEKEIEQIRQEEQQQGDNPYNFSARKEESDEKGDKEGSSAEQ